MSAGGTRPNFDSCVCSQQDGPHCHQGRQVPGHADSVWLHWYQLCGCDASLRPWLVVTAFVFGAELFAADLESFAKHARRTVVSTDDVKLCIRRNPTLVMWLTCAAVRCPPGT